MTWAVGSECMEQVYARDGNPGFPGAVCLAQFGAVRNQDEVRVIGLLLSNIVRLISKEIIYISGQAL